MANRIKFLMQESVDQSDGAGGVNQTWVDKGTVWGTLGNPSGNAGTYDGKSLQFIQRQAELTDARGTGLTIGWRLVAGDQIYEVIAVLSSTHVVLRSTSVDVL